MNLDGHEVLTIGCLPCYKIASACIKDKFQLYQLLGEDVYAERPKILYPIEGEKNA